jgi:acyl carrier protein
MTTNNEIDSKIRSILVDALGVDDDDVTPEALLFKDLGAESIDLLDIVFRLERTFDIRIARGELFPENFSDPELVEGDRLTERGLRDLRGQMPFADLSKLEADPRLESLFDIYTVETLSKYIIHKLRHR